ncbi:MAG: hypothetical protein GXZ15_01800 [Campylobacter sp.]|nr:hypothetical protein [Campylobacter sp.]
MRVFLFFIILFVASYAVDEYDVKNWNDIGQYNKICSDSVKELFIKKQSPTLANMYANACLKMDKINELIIPMVMLYKTKDARENAALYATILFQKKMLYLALVDEVDISYVVMPKVNYILSNVFDKFTAGEYEKVDDIYKIILDKDHTCDLFVENEDGIKQMVVAIYKDGKIISIKKYW